MNDGSWGGTGSYSWYADTTNNLYGKDPLFVDEANLNMALKSNSPAYTISGFKAIPFSQIGAHLDEAVPVASVSYGSVIIANGDSTPGTADGTNFGSVALNASAVSHTFTIRNNGGRGA